MTTIPWPPRGSPPRPARDRERVVDPLPRSVLHALVAGLPGPDKETEAERAARFEAQLAEVLALHPRNSAEAMLATHCVLLRTLTLHTRRNAERRGLEPAMVKKFLTSEKQFQKLLDSMEAAGARRAAQPTTAMNAAIMRALGCEAFLVPDPDDAGQTDEACSAVIVPLHPAPKLLQ